ncbi:MAG: hypothetical protein OXI86_22310, partial [Candidatus Poribacteria bacterium]|nr:hypothetical protein [Candidatus Poribacteria bacterium]
MNRKERLCAVLGGCFGAALTMAVCSFSPIGAQSGDTFGEISCTGLRIVAQDGKTGVTLGTGTEGSFVSVHGTEGKSEAALRLDKKGGQVVIWGVDGNSHA